MITISFILLVAAFTTAVPIRQPCAIGNTLAACRIARAPEACVSGLCARSVTFVPVKSIIARQDDDFGFDSDDASTDDSFDSSDPSTDTGDDIDSFNLGDPSTDTSDDPTSDAVDDSFDPSTNTGDDSFDFGDPSIDTTDDTIDSTDPSVDAGDGDLDSSVDSTGDAAISGGDTSDSPDASATDDTTDAADSTDSTDDAADTASDGTGDSATDSTDSSDTAATDDSTDSTTDAATNSTASAPPASTSSAPDTPASSASDSKANTTPPASPPATAGNCVASIPAINDATVSLIKQFEGFVASPKPDPIGLATVGFGHKCQKTNCAEVPFSFPLSQTTAASLLQTDVKTFTKCISDLVSSSVTLNDNQLGALSAWSFNVGCGLAKTSTLIKRLNAGEDPNTVAAQELPKFNKAGGKVLAGLVRRRAAEVQLFQTSSNTVAHPVC